MTSRLFKKWMYDAIVNATNDKLYYEHFEKQRCPIGKSGDKCEDVCDPEHGTASATGECVCESSKWVGDDCSIEIEEDTNLAPPYLKRIGYAMFSMNMAVILFCGVWLHWQRFTSQVSVLSPSFLGLVLLGCLISTSSILVMARDDNGDPEANPVHSCMAIPWLYSGKSPPAENNCKLHLIR